ncbi:uncharacterized protein OCT59_027660 [Rhizophagus irregularis]|uniref:uncharacterized protein n=1 Tax=Rhizophagus irregularis TaxID=588596 RepID=UPI0019F1AFCC|nr:hypothetical protein OCT59_027660 [Rhizophagus irregularis]GBC15806.2 hypothetical protein GLOIN_2v1482275 [Rhizophagus irregularis DAOM 181602=DAOM 197198]
MFEYNNVKKYFLLWILLQVLVDVNCQLTPFKPSRIYRHTATFIDNKLYILGGSEASTNNLVKEFFYLDVSIPFNTQELSWKDLSKISIVPFHNDAMSAKGGAKNDTLFLYGGFTDVLTMALVYTFDPQHSVWNSQEITGINTIRKSSLTGVIDYNGKFYLWGGVTRSSVNAPTKRYYYGATLLPNNKIIYIGGVDDLTSAFDAETLYINKGTALSLKEVYIYDTINDNWDTKITTGKIPSNRDGFSTILGLDGQRIIIYGGVFNDPGGYVDTTLYVLDLTNFNWDIPKITGNTIPKPRAWHKANAISKYMVITFGYGYNRAVDSDILLLDISNNEEYVWTTSFDPSVPKSSQTSNNSSDNSKMVGAIVGSLLSGIFLSVGGFFLYKWNKKRQSQNNINNYNNYGQEKAVPTDGSKNENMTNHEVVNNDDYYGQEVVTAPNNDGFKFFKFLNKK